MKQMFGLTVINFKENLFIVKRIIPEHHKPIVETWKEHLNCDTVLKHEGNYFFCELIPDAEIITENESLTNEEVK